MDALLEQRDRAQQTASAAKARGDARAQEKAARLARYLTNEIIRMRDAAEWRETDV